MNAVAPQCTVVSDYGAVDGTHAGLVGALNRLGMPVVDLGAHLLPFDVVANAMHLRLALPTWPAHSLHFVASNPEHISSEAGWIAARFDFGWVIAANNGVLHFLQRDFVASEFMRYVGPDADRTQAIVEALPDLFSDSLNEELWAPTESIRLLGVPEPLRYQYRLQGTVVHIDAFGNLISNIQRRDCSALSDEQIQDATERSKIKGFAGARLVSPLMACYNDVEQGEPLVFFNQDGFLEIACRRANASQFFKAERGHRVELVSELELVAQDDCT